MAGRMDSYVGKAVYGAYFAGLVFLLMMTIVFDVLINLGRYLDNAQANGVGTFELVGNLIHFYTLNVPFMFVVIGPFVTVIAGMFAVSRLMGANEVVPMLFTGRSMVRVLRPLLFVGCISAGLMVVCWQYVIPQLTETHDQLRCGLEGQEAKIEDLVVRIRDDGSKTLFCDEYDHASRRVTGIAYVDEGSGRQDAILIRATHADWNPETEAWDLTEGTRSTSSRQEQHDQPTLQIPKLTPDLLWRTSKETKELVTMSYTELRDLQMLRPGRRDFVLAFQTHLTFPLANLILLMLALPFSVHFERGRKIERVLFAVLICAVYLIADLTCQNLSRSGYLHPIFAAWLPPIFFGSLGVVFFGSIRT